MNQPSFIANKLRSAMDAKGYTQYRLFIRSGVPQSRISDLLRGNVTNPRIETLAKLALALDVPVDELIPRYNLKEGVA